MALNFSCSKGQHPEQVNQYFDLNVIDAFYHPDVLNAFFGEEWYAVLIEGEGNAFFHVFEPQSIDGTDEWLDIDPILGYYGPLVNTSNLEFIEKAIALYILRQEQNNIVAEVMRFNPLMKNHLTFQTMGNMKVVEAKKIIVINCYSEENQQLLEFTAKCRSSVKRGIRDCSFQLLDKGSQWGLFTNLYLGSLDRIGADKKWYFSPDIFDQIKQKEIFKIFGVYSDNHLTCVALVIDHPFAGYYLMAASTSNPVQGANEYLIYSISKYLSNKGVKHFILGGGNTSSEEDPLYKFKRKFAKEHTPFYIGKIIHSKSRYDQLCCEAIQKKPDLRNSQFFLKYHL